MTGLVTKSTGSWYDVLGEDGNSYACRIRGKFRLQDKGITNPISVGDRVEFTSEDPHVIETLEPRRNYIIRKSVKKKAQGHMIASNIDQAILIATIHQPRTSLGFIDRFLISSEAFRIPQVLIFNKMDLYNDKHRKLLKRYHEIYTSLGIFCLNVSAHTGEGLDEFIHVLKNKCSLLSGHSGVGKSTLLNKIHPEINQQTAEISGFSDKGTHTTTFAEMFFLDKDTMVIDTPGIKELGLLEMEKQELGDYFPEIRERREECKFNNCLHDNEPSCAIKMAVDNGEITEERYKSYLSMLDDSDNRR